MVVFLFTIDKSKKNKFFNFIRKFYYIKCLPSNKGTEVIYKKIFFESQFMKIFITGVESFIGHYLLDILQKKKKLSGVRDR